MSFVVDWALCVRSLMYNWNNTRIKTDLYVTRELICAVADVIIIDDRLGATIEKSFAFISWFVHWYNGCYSSGAETEFHRKLC